MTSYSEFSNKEKSEEEDESREENRRLQEGRFYENERIQFHRKEIKEAQEALRNKNRRKYKKQLKIAYLKCIDWLKDYESWNPIFFKSEHPNVHLFEKTLDDGTLLIKARGPVKYWSAFDFARTQMDTNYITRIEWDVDLEDIRLVEIIDKAAELQHVPMNKGRAQMPAKLSVVWYRVKTPKLAKALNVWDRDFCCIQYWALKKDGSIIIINQSTEHDKYPTGKAAERSCVRAETTCVIYIKERKRKDPNDKEEPTLYIEMAGWVKPNGWLSEKVASWLKLKMAQRLVFFSNECWANAKTRSKN